MKNLYRKIACGAIALSALAGNAATFVGDRTDFRDETIYFTMTTRFYDGDPNNNVYCWDGVNNIKDPEWRGDFKGLIQKLDYIKALGFTAVWITPVVENASGLDYHGYHALDFSKVDHRYVSKESTAADADVAFQELIDEVHKRGMKLILDIVIQHTGNFGESNLAPMFDKDYTKDLADINASMIPRTIKDGGVLPDNYLNLPAQAQYDTRLALMKNSDFTNRDIHNYYHHKAWFDWDDPSRWWGQIAGDCVDLNTENPAVSNYLVECYSRFIKMGLDGFRIDTAGHIPRLAFNNNFIPQFLEAANSAEAQAKRGNTPFFMFGEVCARSMEVIYRGDNYNCSPCYYTWKENKNYAWDYDPKSWDSVVAIPTATEQSQDYFTVQGHTNWESVLQSATDDKGHADNILRRSSNATLNGNDYHTPDHAEHSGLNVIDFAMHWNFNSARGAYGVRGQDWLYNDATYNVVYVDSHDYAPDSNYRFDKDQATWAENLSLMFTFRGIPCIYYGSEVEFQKGKDIDKGAILALKDTGRAYFGGYIEGDVNVTDFAEYNGATGNLASTLSYPLARHIQRLNKIRAAVPALRKGQYSNEGCSGEMAFKRRYTDSKTDSYVLVTISGDATFTGILNGRYVDAITGDVKNVTNGTLTASCSGKGNLRVYVLDTNLTKAPGKVGEDEKYLYSTASVDHAWTTWPDETMPDETWTVKPVGGGGSTEREEPETPVAPAMEPGEQAIFFEHDSWNTATAWIWSDSQNYTGGSWPGQSFTYLGNNVFKWTYTGEGTIPETAKVIVSRAGNDQSTKDGWKYVNGGYYNLNGYVKTIEVNSDNAYVSLSPNGGEFDGVLTVTATANAKTTSAWYKIGNGVQKSFTGTTTFTLGEDMQGGESVTVTWSATGATGTFTGSATYTKKPEGAAVDDVTVFFDNSRSGWDAVNIHYWVDGGKTTQWPGVAMQKVGGDIYTYTFGPEHNGIIFNAGQGKAQTKDIKGSEIVHNHIYTCDSDGNNVAHEAYNAAIEGVSADSADGVKVEVIDGKLVLTSSRSAFVTISDLAGRTRTMGIAPGVTEVYNMSGFYIVNGKKVLVR